MGGRARKTVISLDLGNMYPSILSMGWRVVDSGSIPIARSETMMTELPEFDQQSARSDGSWTVLDSTGRSIQEHILSAPVF
jgi:hypothetical protein